MQEILRSIPFFFLLCYSVTGALQCHLGLKVKFVRVLSVAIMSCTACFKWKEPKALQWGY